MMADVQTGAHRLMSSLHQEQERRQGVLVDRHWAMTDGLSLEDAHRDYVSLVVARADVFEFILSSE